nr:hypothetical protein [Tanacetum cinerariifolium]
MTNYRYWLPITSSSWSFISAILGQMTYLVADSTPNCAKSEELFEPRFELDDQEWVEMGSFLFDLLGSSMRKGLLLLRVIEEEGKKTKSRRTKESESSKKPSTTKQTSKGKAPIKASKIGKSTSAKEQVKEPIVEVVMDDAGDNVARDVNQAQDTSEPKTRKTLNPDLFKQPPRPPTLDPEWNKYKLDWNNPEGYCYPFDLSKPLHLQGPLGHRTVTADYFFNNDMEYLKSSDPEVTYTTSITKTKAARYEIKGIEDMVPTLWSAIKHAYDKDAKKEIKHWGERCKLWYRSQRSKLSKQNVYSNKVILGVKSVSVKKLHKYGHLEEIVVKRSDQQLYKFKEGDFGKKTKSRRTKESESSKKPSTTKQTSKGNAPTKASKIGKSTSAKEQVKEPIVEVVMDDAGDNVARDVNQAQDTSEPKTRKTLNPYWFKQPPRPPTLDPEWNKCHRTVAADYFFNNDIEYLKTSDPEVTYTTSITKTNAAWYEIKGIEDMVPTLWSAIKHAYDKDAKKEIKHWGERCKLWYLSQRSKLSKQNVYSNKAILGVKSVSVKKLHEYGHIEEIVVKRSDQQLYKFKEGDFVDLHLNDIEDMLLLVVQHKLFLLDDNVIVDFIVALYLNKQKRVLRADEWYKFSDGKLKSVRDEIYHRVLEFCLDYNPEMPKRKWIDVDPKRSSLMIELNDKKLQEREIIKSGAIS